LCSQVSQGAGAWLGLSEQDQGDATTDRWLQRRAALHGKGSLLIGSGLSQKCKNKLECQEDIALPTPRDPLHRPGTQAFVLLINSFSFSFNPWCKEFSLAYNVKNFSSAILL